MLGVIVGTVLIGGALIPIALQMVSDLASLCIVASRMLSRSSAMPDHSMAGHASGRLLFLVPAHDEEETISAAVESILELSLSGDQYDVAVIADNCSDRTAELARNAGARCYERQDPAHPGKPQAIAWALEQVDLHRYDAVVIIDADSKVDPGYGSAILQLVDLPHVAFQGYNGVSNPDENALTRLAALLSVVYYRFAYVLKVRAGLNAPLTGAGMGIGTAVLREYGWQAFTLGEDVEKYVFLTLRGVRIGLISSAGVRSQEAAKLDVASSQRQRWRSGRLQIFGKYARSVVTARKLGWRQRLDVFSELLGYGPAMHVGVAALISLAMWTLYGLSVLACLLLFTAAIFRPLAYTLLALTASESPLQTLRALSVLPVYIVWRTVQEILAILNVRSSDWIRTARR